jgi:hypothetical protein
VLEIVGVFRGTERRNDQNDFLALRGKVDLFVAQAAVSPRVFTLFKDCSIGLGRRLFAKIPCFGARRRPRPGPTLPQEITARQAKIAAILVVTRVAET